MSLRTHSLQRDHALDYDDDDDDDDDDVDEEDHLETTSMKSSWHPPKVTIDW